jgi:hypothetical protein
MTILTLADAKAHMNVWVDDDDTLIANKIAAAEAWIGAYIGQTLASIPSPYPDTLLEATRQLVAHLYNNREASLVGTNIVDNCPGMFDLLAPYRTWTF